MAKRLLEIFESREKDLVFRRGTNETEKTVEIRSTGKRTYREMMKIIDSVKMAGANPIILDPYIHVEKVVPPPAADKDIDS